MMGWKRIELKEGELVQFVGTHAVSYPYDSGVPPTVGFVEDDEAEAELDQARAWSKAWKELARQERSLRKHCQELLDCGGDNATRLLVKDALIAITNAMLEDAQAWARAWKAAAKEWRVCGHLGQYSIDRAKQRIAELEAELAKSYEANGELLVAVEDAHDDWMVARAWSKAWKAAAKSYRKWFQPERRALSATMQAVIEQREQARAWSRAWKREAKYWRGYGRGCNEHTDYLTSMFRDMSKRESSLLERITELETTKERYRDRWYDAVAESKQARERAASLGAERDALKNTASLTQRKLFTAYDQIEKLMQERDALREALRDAYDYGYLSPHSDAECQCVICREHEAAWAKARALLEKEGE